MQHLIDRVKAADYTVINAVKETGPAVTPELVSLASHADGDVRELALHCLGEIGGPAAIDAFVGGLLDPEATVRAAAMRGLHRHVSTVSGQSTQTLPERLYAAYDRSDDPIVRQNIALILGKTPGASAAELERRWQIETDGSAQEGCVVALARLGHPVAQGEYKSRLVRSTGQNRVRLLEHGFYIHQPWLLPVLRPLLDDLSIALRIGVDGVGFVPEHLRMCDLAVVLIVSISAHTFSFQVDRKTNFTAFQLAEVRAWLG